MSSEKHPIELIEDLADATGGAVTDVTLLSDGSGFAMLSTPLREDHWIYETDRHGGSGPSPMPMAGDCRDPMRVIFEGHLRIAARHGIRSSTRCGRENDFDPDAMERNIATSLFGYYGANSPYSFDLEFEPKTGGILLHVVEDALDERGRRMSEIRERVNRRLATDVEQVNNLDPDNLIHPAFHVELKTLGALLLRHNKSHKTLLEAMSQAAVKEWGVDPETASRVIFSGLSVLVNFDKPTLKDWNAFDEERRRKWNEANPQPVNETIAGCDAAE